MQHQGDLPVKLYYLLFPAIPWLSLDTKTLLFILLTLVQVVQILYRHKIPAINLLESFLMDGNIIVSSMRSRDTMDSSSLSSASAEISC